MRIIQSLFTSQANKLKKYKTLIELLKTVLMEKSGSNKQDIEYINTNLEEIIKAINKQQAKK